MPPTRPGHRFAASIVTLAAFFAVAAAPPALASGPAAPPFADPVQMTPELQTQIQGMVSDFVGPEKAPGVSVSVVTPDATGENPVTTTFTAGTLAFGSSDPVDVDTRFELGSETKVFTADLLAALVADSTVSLDDPVSKYAPDDITVPTGPDGTPMTLRHLATHTAALPDLPPHANRECAATRGCENWRPGYTRQMLWDALDQQTLAWEPGTAWFYSNFGFALLGTILSDRVYRPQTMTDVSTLQELLDTTFLGPLDMTSTVLEPYAPGENFASPTTVGGGSALLWRNVNAFAGGGGLISNARDLSAWVRSHLGYATGSDAPGVATMQDTLDQAISVTLECASYLATSCTERAGGVAMGLGWELHPASAQSVGTPWAFKDGGTDGSSSDTVLAWEKGVGVTSMWNRKRSGDPASPIAELSRSILTLIVQSGSTPPIEDPEPEPEPSISATATAAPPAPSPSPSPSPTSTVGPPAADGHLAHTGLGAAGTWAPLASATVLLGAGAFLVARRRRPTD